MPTPFERFRSAKETLQAILPDLSAEQGRLSVGPSSTTGVYIRATAGGSEGGKITGITEDEARFLADYFAKVFGWTDGGRL